MIIIGKQQLSAVCQKSGGRGEVEFVPSHGGKGDGSGNPQVG